MKLKLTGEMTSAGGGGGAGAPVQSMVTVPVSCGVDLSKTVMVVVDGDVIPLTVTAAPLTIPVCGLSTGDVGLVVAVVTTE